MSFKIKLAAQKKEDPTISRPFKNVQVIFITICAMDNYWISTKIIMNKVRYNTEIKFLKITFKLRN